MDALALSLAGNVRELQNFIERAVILSPRTVLRAPTSELEPFSAHKGSNLPIWVWRKSSEIISSVPLKPATGWWAAGMVQRNVWE